MGKKQPAHEIKLGRIRVTIWANEAEDHEVRFNAVVSRLYKSGDVWKDTTSLKYDDLPVASKAIDMAFNWIHKKQNQLQHTERKAANKKLANVGNERCYHGGMAITEQIADFTAFAQRLADERDSEDLTLEAIIDEWQALNKKDVAAIREAIESYEAGERGIPAEEAMQQLRARVQDKFGE